MLASIDVGSNTVRMLLARFVEGRLTPHRYQRAITRLGGDFSESTGLARESMRRTLEALRGFAELLHQDPPERLRMVGTEALRRAPNRARFIAQVEEETGLVLEVIDGREEAQLSAMGVLEALVPQPGCCLVIDIGGGSTELVLLMDRQVVFRQSYPIGVVRLCEEDPSPDSRERKILAMLDRLQNDLVEAGFESVFNDVSCECVGTAGTVTSLAALDQKMRIYDWRLINNYQLSLETLERQHKTLLPLTALERESLPGIEAGRGDLIVPGLEIILTLLRRFNRSQLKISDFGLLEGIILDLNGSRINPNLR